MKTILKIAPALLLTVMVLISFFSVLKDATIMDEVAHIPAGYSYLKFQDYRLNPEHPPLLKMLSAAPLLFLDLKFPLDHPAWTTAINGQWVTGYQFLYHLGNDADQILFWSRLPVIALLILLGIYVWKWSREILGQKWALFVLALYAFSPTIIAHSHYVTTDLVATTFFFIAFYYFTHYLKSPTWMNIIKAGVALGFAHLAKFSSILLLPTYALLILIPCLLKKPGKTSWPKQLASSLVHYLAIILLSLIVVVLVYIPVVFHFSLEKQQELIIEVINPTLIEGILLKMSELPGARAITQYILGVVMVFARVGGGNTNYFLGQVSNQGWFYYFPTCFLLKETISVLILTGLAILYALRKFVTNLRKERKRKWFVWFKKYCLEHGPEIVMILFIFVYGVVSMQGKLNIGVRHIMILFPFLYILIIKEFMRRYRESKFKNILLGFLSFLIIWIIVENILIYPSYLAYYNQLTGGPQNGYIYITDSNLDWGQDLGRLATWVDERGIKKIKVDYFGGGDPAYYLGDKYEEWHADRSKATGWIAVSATYLSESNYRQDAPADAHYFYLEPLEPKAVIGYSIFVYYVPET